MSDGEEPQGVRRIDLLKRRFANWRRRRRLTRRELDDIESRIVWILGSPRSGSTWLLEMLAEAPAPGTARLDEPRVGELLWHSFVFRRPGDKIISFGDTQRDNPFWILSESRADIWQPWLRGLILEMFRDQVRHGVARTHWRRPVLIVREPNSSEAADVMVSIMPRSRILFLVRDGRDVTDSLLDAFTTAAWGSVADQGWDGLRSEERAEFIHTSSLNWVYRTEAVQRASDTLGPAGSLTVRYEDLLADTTGELTRITGWLGINGGDEWAAKAAAEHSFEAIPAERRGSGKRARAANPGLWRENMSESEQLIMEQVMGEKLRELGYE
jgi:hypothetical protein